ncbi:HdeD family acid-resistance protein [Methylocystis sp. 9N]|uniref:HdeD family acid-resistance protein n=1 Tax=Methylocystis borbori TaxID=3118750 RepID=A0ABU7XKU0_9HYPH
MVNDSLILETDPLHLHHLRRKWGWLVALGVLLLIGGVVALYDVTTATLVTVFYVGAAMLVCGALEVITAFQIRPWPRALLLGAVGLLTIGAGFLAFRDPLLAAVSITGFLGFALIIAGAFRLVLAFHIREVGPWLLVALSGLVSIVLGGLIVSQWPVSGLYVLGLFLAVNLIFEGISWITVGLSAKP